MAALGWLLNLDFAGSSTGVPVPPPVVVQEDTGRDSGGGKPWWTGEWITPPREPIPVKAEIIPDAHRPRVTPEQKARLDESLTARVQIAALKRDLERLDRAVGAVAPTLQQAHSRRAKQRLYNERSRLKREKQRTADRIVELERRAEHATKELQGLEWLAFLQSEDEQFMKLMLELI